MKTINFLHIVKYPVLLFIAIFGLFIGGTQVAPRSLSKPAIADIGGQAVPRLQSGGTNDIGGSQSVPRSILSCAANESVQDSDIGGNSAPRTGLLTADKNGLPNASFENSPIGGQGVPPTRPFYDVSDLAPQNYAYHSIDIGGVPGTERRGLYAGNGKQASLISGTDIGGAQGAPRTGISSDDIGGGQLAPRTVIGSYEIGGPGNPPRTYII